MPLPILCVCEFVRSVHPRTTLRGHALNATSNDGDGPTQRRLPGFVRWESASLFTFSFLQLDIKLEAKFSLLFTLESKGLLLQCNMTNSGPKPVTIKDFYSNFC